MFAVKWECRPRLLVTALACVFIAASSPAKAWEINFDDLFLGLGIPVVGNPVQGRIIDDEYATTGRVSDHDDSLTATFAAYHAVGKDNPLLAVLFDTGSLTSGSSHLGAPFSNSTFGSLSPGNILVLHDNSGQCRDAAGAHANFSSGTAVSCDNPDDVSARPAGRFVIEFNKPIHLTSIDFFAVEPPPSGAGHSNEILLFDVNGSQVLDSGPFYTPDTGGDNKWDQVVFNTVGVKKIEIRLAGPGGIDNIVGADSVLVAGDIGVIPEPGTAAALVAGLVVFGVVRRRRRAGRQ